MSLIKEFKNILSTFGLEYFSRYYGVYRAIVTDNNDPDKKCRLKITVPQIYGGEHNYWALPKGIYSGSNMGFVAIPKIGDSVWVQFENGDAQFPIWEYGTFNNLSVENYPDGVLLKINEEIGLLFNPVSDKIELRLSDDIKIQLTDLIELGKTTQPTILGNEYVNFESTIIDQLEEIRQQLNKLSQSVLPNGSTGTANIIAIQAILSTVKLTLESLNPNTLLTKKVRVE